MTSLFLNTASSYLSTAILIDNKVIDEKYIKLDKELSKLALSEIKNMLEKNQVALNTIDEIICVDGPGSFTGLRVGVTISKTLAYSLSCKLYKASNLFLMATSINDNYIIPIINARHNCVYAAIYNKEYEVVMEEKYITLDELKSKISKLDNSYTLVSSDEFEFNTKKYTPNLNNFFKYLKKEEQDVFRFEPNYLKKTQAEEELNDKRN